MAFLQEYLDHGDTFLEYSDLSNIQWQFVVQMGSVIPLHAIKEIIYHLNQEPLYGKILIMELLRPIFDNLKLS